ncbi:MAG TPA: xanthine dehydrogenase family protein molybdopterin-binding subunit [Candidatus Limnocylindrales bacterium]|nr:xanthine dehydrogenase family protein molybdopterin-binding subunit [Candidatus Limnocylindrales bacterium]
MADLRILKSKDEFEGEIYESTIIVEGRDLVAPKIGAPSTEIGKPRGRIDGRKRVSGTATYTQDVQLAGMLHAQILRSPYPRARVRAIDTKKADALPGVRGILHRFNAPEIEFRSEKELFREEVRFIGDDVAAVVADTEDIAREALALIEVDYEILPHVADLEEAIGAKAPKLTPDGNVFDAGSYKRGDVRKAFKDATTTVEATYRTSTQMHNALETHGAVASWDGERLTIWESTQAVFGVRDMVKDSLKLQPAQVHVICDFMGGGFGAKLGTYKYSLYASLFTMRLGRPVRCIFSRREENLAAGNRSATLQTLRLGGADGRIVALEHESWSNSGQGRWAANPTGPTNTLYDIANVASTAHRVMTNAGALSAFRAPGYVEGTFALESAIDELATAMNVDPLLLRRRHARSTIDPRTGNRYSLKRLIDCYTIGAKEIGWSKRRREGTRGSSPHRKRGIGMATQIWGGGGGPPAYATVHFETDGTAVVRVGVQDIGTGTRTTVAQICADEIGLSLEQVVVRLGDTDAPFGPGSGGSVTLASIGPAVRLAANEARGKLLAAAGGVLEVRADELRLEKGVVVSKGARTPLKEILSKLSNSTIVGNGLRHPNPTGVSIKTFGAHFAQVEVDMRTGEIFVEKIVAVHDIGRIINPLTAASQVQGGVMQALGFALTEERIVDRRLGRVMNPNLEWYEIPTVMDTPEIVVRFVDAPDRKANNIGAKGLGEPPIIPTAAAIANAFANATGARVRHVPMTRARVLDALALANAS